MLNYLALIFNFTVDGGWGPYICGRCSVTCGKGRLTCTRECNNPSPANRGKNCVGPFSRVHPCDEGCCPGTHVTNIYTAQPLLNP